MENAYTEAEKQQAEAIDPGKISVPRHLSKFWQAVVSSFVLFGVFLAINQVLGLRLFARIGAWYFEFESAYLYVLFVCFLSITFIIFPSGKKPSARHAQWWDVLLFGLTVFIGSYLSSQAFEITRKGWAVVAPLHLGVMASILCIIVLEAVRRTAGLVLLFVCLFFALLPTFTGYLPGIFKGNQFPLWDTIVFHSLGVSSIIGIPAQVYGDLIVGFLVFGVVLQATGGARAFMVFSLALLGTQKGGPAKVAILSSGLFGSLSGSAVSNVLTTGSVTIPAMKKAGYPPELAGAVEACASTGGLIMPPVMGAVAFLIASFLGMSYFLVCMAAVIPALLYYFALFMQVHFYAEAHRLEGFPRSQIPSLKQAVHECWPYMFSLVVLVYFLYLGLEARAPFGAAGFLILLSMIRKKTRLHLKEWWGVIQNLGKVLAMMLAILAGIGFIVGAFSITGIGTSFAHEVYVLAGANILALLALTALGSFILGMGMPALPCYIFLIIVVAPALLQAGFVPIAIHLFIFYWALSSNLTPPVALAAYTGAIIAESNFLKTAFKSMRLGFLIYFLPFCFVFVPELLLQKTVMDALVPLVTAMAGITLLASGFEGYFPKLGRLPIYYKFPIFVSGLLLIIPEMKTNIGGIFLFLLTLAVLLLTRRRFLAGMNLSRERR